MYYWLIKELELIQQILTQIVQFYLNLGATTSTKVLRNKTDPDSEVPPTTGWEYCTGCGGNNSWELIQQIEVYCIIKPR